MTKKDIVNHVSLFLNCRVTNPQFTSATKDCLFLPKISIKLPDMAVAEIGGWQLLEQICREIQRKQLTKVKKTDTLITADNMSRLKIPL